MTMDVRLAFLGLIICLASTEALAEPERYLLAVGNNRGVAGEVTLQYAEKDAHAYAKALQRRGQVKRSNTRVLTGAGKASVLGALRKMAGKLKGQSSNPPTFFFYYSGHGNKDELHLGGDRLSLRELERQIEGLSAGLKIAVIDACRTDRKLKYKGFRRTQGFAIKLDSPEGVKGVVTLKSSSQGEASQESDELRGAVFTHYFLTALRGAGDRDRDKKVSLDEAYTYAYRQTVRRSAQGPGNIMHPTAKIAVEGAGQVILTKTSRGAGQLVLPRGGSIQYLLYRKPSGSVDAEVWGMPDRAVTLSVPAGRYLLQRRGRGISGAYEFSIRKGHEETVSQNAFHAYPQETLAAKGGFLSIWRHEFKTSYMPLFNHRDKLGHKIRLAYAYGAAMWNVGLGVDVGTEDYALGNYGVAEQWLGGDVTASFKRLLGPFDLNVGLAWRLSQQTLTRLDENLLGNVDYSTESSVTGLSLGPMVSLGWRLFLSPRWFMGLECSANGWFRQEGKDVTLHTEVGAGLSLGVDI
jgi:hypothetical protein